MEFFFDGRNGGNMSMYKNDFESVTGTIVDIVPSRTGNRRAGCANFMMVEDEDGNVVQFLVSNATFVVDWEPLTVGMTACFWYRANAAVPLIYPPQYQAVVAAQEKNGRMVDVSYYNASFVNQDKTLQLNVDPSVKIRTPNNQLFQGSPAKRNLAVIYSNSTRSIPAQTTPDCIVVLC